MTRHDMKLYQYKCQLIKENSQELMIFFDEAGIITDYNNAAAEALGYGDTFAGITVRDVFKKSFRLEDNKLIIQPRFTEGPSETVAYRKNQTCFAVNLKIITIEGKTFVGLCLASDISEKNRIIHDFRHAKRELKTTRQFKKEFVANITHELKTPVNGIKGLTENLMETELTPKQLETLNIIHRCCGNMNTLINNLLDYTKIGSNKLILEKLEFPFRKFINDIVNFNIFLINEKGLKLIVNVSDEIPEIVIGDECRLAQVLNNLLSNAIKFTAVGQVALEVVKTYQTENEVELFFMVMDTGIGISLEDKDKLFQNFSQVDSSITRRFGGTGLGLSICSMLVKAMHGNITVDSEENKGSTFSFTVRLGIAKEQAAAMDPESDYWYIDRHVTTEDINPSWDIGKNYLGRILEEANFSLQSIQKDRIADKEDGITNTGREQSIRTSVEMLMLCFNMDNWTKAEEVAYTLKKLIPEELGDLRNKALQLLLSIRKEDHERSMGELKELVDMIKEVTPWRI